MAREAILLKKWAALAAILLLVGALVLGGFQYLGGKGRGGAGIQLMPRTLVGGELNNITISGVGGRAALHLPWGLLLRDASGTFNGTRRCELGAGSQRVEVLVSPWLNGTSVNISSDGANRTFRFAVQRGTDPVASGEGMYRYLSQLTSGYPRRQTGIPGHYAAADWIKSQLDGMGIPAEVRHYRWNDRAASRLGPGPIIDRPVADILDVVGIKQGELKDEWIVVGAHFDNSPSDRYSGEGAYDNGSGTCLMLELARAISQMETRRTFVFAAWGGEEEGLIGAERFVQDLPPGVTVKFNLNLDMVGIAYPADQPAYLQVGPNATEEIDHPELWAITENITYEAMNISRNDTRIEVEEGTGGGSDHTRFQQIGTPTVFMITGYGIPSYHSSEDTLDYMVQYAGGMEPLLQGFDLCTWISMLICLSVDSDESIRQGEVPYQ